MGAGVPDSSVQLPSTLIAPPDADDTFVIDDADADVDVDGELDGEDDDDAGSFADDEDGAAAAFAAATAADDSADSNADAESKSGSGTEDSESGFVRRRGQKSRRGRRHASGAASAVKRRASAAGTGARVALGESDGDGDSDRDGDGDEGAGGAGGDANRANVRASPTGSSRGSPMAARLDARIDALVGCSKSEGTAESALPPDAEWAASAFALSSRTGASAATASDWDQWVSVGGVLPPDTAAAAASTLDVFEAAQAGGLPSLFYGPQVSASFFTAAGRAPDALSFFSLSTADRVSALVSPACRAREAATRVALAHTIARLIKSPSLKSIVSRTVTAAFGSGATPPTDAPARAAAESPDSDGEGEAQRGRGGPASVAADGSARRALGDALSAALRAAGDASAPATSSARAAEGVTIPGFATRDCAVAQGTGYGASLGGFLRILERAGAASGLTVGRRAKWLPPPPLGPSARAAALLISSAPALPKNNIPTPFGVFAHDQLQLSLAALDVLPVSHLPPQIFADFAALSPAARTALRSRAAATALGAADAVTAARRAALSEARDSAWRLILGDGEADAVTVRAAAAHSVRVALPVAPRPAWEFAARSWAVGARAAATELRASARALTGGGGGGPAVVTPE